MDLSAFYNQFRDETAENIRALGDGLLALEGLTPNDASYRTHIDAIFRAVHTIKGSARLLGFEAVGQLAHTLEHILGSLREGQRTLDRRLTNDLLRGGDAITELVAAALEGRAVPIDVERLATQLGHELPEVGTDSVFSSYKVEAQAQPTDEMALIVRAASPPSAPLRPVAARQTIRVRVDRLDRLLNLAGELALEHQAQVARGRSLQELQLALDQQARALAGLVDELGRLRFSPAQRDVIDQRLHALHAPASEARQIVKSQLEYQATHSDQRGLLIDDLEQEVMAARLLPVATVFTHLPRAVRELSDQLDKHVTLTLTGETTELDRKLLEMLNEPLIHLVRNALDHGIEAPDERPALGKPPAGQLVIGATASGGEVRVTVSDDGRGLHPQRLRDSAVRKGLFSAQAIAQLSDAEALDLIFLPGFSTASIITDVSGRGVGLDIVRTNILELGGRVLIDSVPGQGATFTLVLPLTLVTSRVVLVQLAGAIYALPASGCRGTVWTQATDVVSIEGQAMIDWEGHIMPLLRLADLLGITGAVALERMQRLPVVVIGIGPRPIGLLVDRLYDEREALVKPLGPLWEARRRYSGVVQLDDGQLVLLLNPILLAQEARGMPAQATSALRHPERARASLLVVDDSFTTRELIRSILQSAGYQVTLAIDGTDALDKLRAHPYDLVVSDVEMPRMSGFQLTTRIRHELGLIDLPIVIMTSLASDDDKRQGLEAGAQAYIVKSQFHQDTLLETIRQLLGR